MAGAHPGSAELYGASRRALRRCRSRAGALAKGGTLTVLKFLPSRLGCHALRVTVAARSLDGGLGLSLASPPGPLASMPKQPLELGTVLLGAAAGGQATNSGV